MNYTLIDKVNYINPLRTIDFEPKSSDYNNTKMKEFYDLLYGFFYSDDCNTILNTKYKYGYSDSLITHVFFTKPVFILGASPKRIDKYVSSYYILTSDDKVISFGDDSNYIFIYTVYKYLEQYYYKYIKRNLDSEMIKYKEMYKEKEFDIDTLAIHYIFERWEEYYKKTNNKLFMEQLLLTAAYGDIINKYESVIRVSDYHFVSCPLYKKMDRDELNLKLKEIL